MKTIEMTVECKVETDTQLYRHEELRVMLRVRVIRTQYTQNIPSGRECWGYQTKHGFTPTCRSLNMLKNYESVVVTLCHIIVLIPPMLYWSMKSPW